MNFLAQLFGESSDAIRAIKLWRDRFPFESHMIPVRPDGGLPLLLRQLSPDAQTTLQTEGWFLVQGSAGGYWVIYHGLPYKVLPQALPSCIVTRAHIPVCDRSLALKLWLEVDEEAVARTVGRSGVLLE